MKTSFLTRHIAINLSLLAFIILLLVGVFLYLYKISPPKQTVNTNGTINLTLPTQSIQNASPNPQPKLMSGSSLTSSDTVWNTYTNNALGISLKIPKVASAGCPSSSSEVKTYPIFVVEDRQDVVIATAMGTQTIDMGCHTVALTEADIKNGIRQNYPNLFYSSWTIKVRSVKDESEIDAYIKNTYGTGCSMGAITESKQKGVYDVVINGDGKNLDETLCPTNFGIALKYSPEKQKIANWNLGQDITFYDGYETIYDTKILDSFTFN